MNQGEASEEDYQPGYDQDDRDKIGEYYVQKTHNFIRGAKYDEFALNELGEKLSYTDAMNVAAERAKARGAYGFFY